MAIARGSVTIVDLTDGRTVTLYLDSNLPTTQVFDEGVGTYAPDWTVSSLVVTPEVYVSGETEDQVSKLKPGSVKWTINGQVSVAGSSVSSTNPYALSISQNMISATQYKINCEATYVDPLTLVEVPIKSTITFTKAQNSGNSIIAVAYAPDGTVFNESVSNQPLKARCDMWRGATIDNTDVSYKWYIRSTGDWIEITEAKATELGISGRTSNTISIPSSAVLNFASFKCEITDTDSGAATFGQVVSDSVSFIDVTDPYTVTIEGADQITTSVQSTTLMPYLEQGGERLDESVQGTFTWTWRKTNSDGNPDSDWRTTGSVVRRDLTVTKTDVVGRAIFTVDVTE